jgi:hypothetical protein
VGATGWWLLALFAAIAAVLLINPVGYIGGGLDDWQYLNAARCWRDHPPCLPHDHWSGRWPLVLPFGLVLSSLGESRFTVAIIPLLASICCLFLLARLGNRLFGSPVGWISALLLLAVPGFSIKMLMPSADALELAFVLAGFCALVEWRDSRKLLWPALAGLSLSMAIQVRETSVFAAATAAGLILCSPRMRSPRALSVAAVSFAAPFLIEFAVFGAWTGDPLWRRHLSMYHTQIPSTELVGAIDRSRPPFFNKEYIANWRFSPGIHVHWLLDGILNLIVNPIAGFSLALVPLLLLVGKRTISAHVRRAVVALWLVALLNALALIFVLAINPTPRMMLFPLSAAILALALLTSRMFAKHPALVWTVWLFCGVTGATLLAVSPRTYPFETEAAQAIRQHGQQIETDETTRRMLALVRESRTLGRLGSGKPFLLIYSGTSCRQWLAKSGLAGALSVVAEYDPTSRLAGSIGRRSAPLCLFRSLRPLPVDAEQQGIARASFAREGRSRH